MSARTEAARATRSAPGSTEPTWASSNRARISAEKIVVAARLHCGQLLAEAGNRERVVAHGADVMLRLPDTPALDARARVERVDDTPPEDVPWDPALELGKLQRVELV